MENKLVEEEVLVIPSDVKENERQVWVETIEMIKSSTSYKKILADRELVRQYVQLTLMRNRAWDKWNENPERYIKIVTGLSQDGKTPKIMVKENEHYKTFIECNKHIEKILTDLRLTPKARKHKWM